MVRLVRRGWMDTVSLDFIWSHNYKILFLGEVHEQEWLVRVHQKLLSELCRRGRLGFLALEYFNVYQQEIVTRWFRGEASWEYLVEEYSRGPEGFNLEVYKPMLETARACGTPIIGVMPPRTVAQQVSRSGVIPSLPNGCIDPRDYPLEYQCLLEKLLPRHGPMARIPVSRLVLAQSYKDSIASWNIARAYEESGSGVVVMGWVHVEALGGVASRTARLLGLDRGEYLVVGARNSVGWHPQKGLLEECLITDYYFIRE